MKSDLLRRLASVLGQPSAADPLVITRRTVARLVGLAADHGTSLVAAAFTACLIVAAARELALRWRHARFAREARLVEITPPASVELAGAEMLWALLLGLLRPAWARLLVGQPHVGFEYAVDQGAIRVRMWVPGCVPPGQVEHAIAAAWPGAHTDTLPAESLPVVPRAAACGGRLGLARGEHYPLRTSFVDDPLRGLLEATGNLAPGQHVLVQVLVRPVTGRRLRRASHAAAALRGTPSTGMRGMVFDSITPARSATRGTARPEAAGEARAIGEKAAKPRLETSIRYTVATDTDTRRDRAWRRGRAHAIAGAFAVFTSHNHLARRRLHRPTHAVARRLMRRGDLLSTSELAAIAHLPLDEAVPGLARAAARPVPPPPAIAAGGPNVRIVGDADAGPRQPIAWRVADARHHCQIIGPNGTGKTTLVLNLALADAEAGRGFAFLEPKGDSELLLSRLPAEAAKRVVLFDPDDAAPPPSLNILRAGDPEVATDTVVGIFRRIYADSWGPRTEDVLRSACLTLARHQPEATLGDVPRLLTDPTYRASATAAVTDPELRRFWDWFHAISDEHRREVTAPLMNKLRSVLLRGFARDVLAHPSTLDLTEVVNTGGILIARLPKGRLGADTSRLLGSIILAHIWQAVLARAALPENQRPDTAIYLDECHNFLRLPRGIADMVDEARGYHAGLVLAHQDLAQLRHGLRDEVSANARNKIAFAVSPEDARALEPHVRPHLTAYDLAHLDKYQAAARLMAGHAQAPAFTMRTRALPPPIEGRQTLIRRGARTNAAPRPPGGVAPVSPSRSDPRRDPA